MSLAISELWQVTSYLAGEEKGVRDAGVVLTPASSCPPSEAWGARSGLLQ